MAEALKDNLKLLGRYSILKELRRDRYTAAYLAFDPVLNRELVVKAVQLRAAAGQEGTGHDRIEQAFMRQAQAAGRLHHPHIVTVFDAGRLRNVGYLALEKVDGRLLSDALADGFRPGFLEAADLVARIADAVEYAHARGVPHGHLGASRIYLQADRSPRVMGFGGWIDTGVTGDFELAATHAMLPYFENELGAEARRKDVQALGALLFLLMTGVRPELKTLRQRDRMESAIIDLRPTAPLVLAEIAESALGLRNLRPYGSAAQMRNALTGYLWGQREAQALPNAVTIMGTPSRLEIAPPSASLPASVTKTRTRIGEVAPRRSKGRIAALAVACLVVLGLGLAGWQQGQPDAAAEPRPTSVAPAAKIDAGAAVTTQKPATNATASPARTSAQTTRFGPPGANATADTQGEVQIAAAPWGDVYVDGAPRGTASPLLQLTLPAGRHTIEVRNGDRPPHVAQIEVAPERPQRISHRFQ